MPVYALAAFVIIGVFAGWLGGMLLKGRGLRPIGNMTIGSIGAIAGGRLPAILGFPPPVRWDRCSQQRSVPPFCWPCSG
jgi:uncharacterized membrane protein YeaQ/YmgE (transglycosylase-associated protein family)